MTYCSCILISPISTGNMDFNALVLVSDATEIHLLNRPDRDNGSLCLWARVRVYDVSLLSVSCKSFSLFGGDLTLFVLCPCLNMGLGRDVVMCAVCECFTVCECFKEGLYAHIAATRCSTNC